MLHSAIDYAIISMDLSGLVTIWNEGASRILGWSEEEMLGQTVALIFTPEDRDAEIPQKEMQSALAEGSGSDQRWHVRSDGSRFWASGEMMVLRSEDGAAEGFLKILRDRTVERQSAERQKLLMHELDHRLKNTFSVVQSIITQSLKNAESLDDASATLQARVRAYARAHDILLRENWTNTNLAVVVEATAVNLGVIATERFHSEGPSVRLGPQATLSLSLVLHELGTNARKYGALSNEEGRIDVTWRVDGQGGDRTLILFWNESGGPEVEAPSRQGFGSKLVASSLQGFGSVSVEYDVAGFTLEFQAPLAKLQSNEGFEE